ncbi:MAG: hypothetical protein ACYS76_04890 [Planctomycetota bacterium]|jgi:hypothetical protein
MKTSRLLWWVAVIWFHTALIFFFALLPFALSNPKLEPLLWPSGHTIPVFLGGGCAANAVSALVLLRLGRNRAKWSTLRQFVVGFLACLPFYGPFYYTSQLKKLQHQPGPTRHTP